MRHHDTELAPEAPRLPRRIAAPYCRECGNAGEHWAGCPGSATNARTTARLENERTPLAVLGGPAEQGSGALGGAL